MLKSREQDFKKNTSIQYFIPQYKYPWGGGHEIYNFLSPFYTGATFQIGKDWPSSS